MDAKHKRPPTSISPSDLLTLAYRLVVARQALPLLLENWNAGDLLEAARRVAPDSNAPLVEADRLMSEQFGDLQPEPVWAAWMQTLHADKLKRLLEETSQ